MTRQAWCGLALAACRHDDGALAGADPSPYADCSAIERLVWEQPDGFDETGWTIARTFDHLGWSESAAADFDEGYDLTQTWVNREDGQVEFTDLDIGPDGVIDQAGTWTFGGDDLADTREYRDVLADRIFDRSEYTNVGGVQVAEAWDDLGD